MQGARSPLRPGITVQGTVLLANADCFVWGSWGGGLRVPVEMSVDAAIGMALLTCSCVASPPWPVRSSLPLLRAVVSKTHTAQQSRSPPALSRPGSAALSSGSYMTCRVGGRCAATPL